MYNRKNLSQKIKYSFIKILTGSDLSSRRLPLMEIKSQNSGPVVWLCACIHGDEVGGIVVVQEIFKMLRKTPLLKGTIYAFPLMNPIGFEAVSRHVALSEEDLNRSFPGDKNGSLAQRIAEKIFNAIAQTKPDLVLDLHNDWQESIPYTEIDHNPGLEYKKTYEKVKLLSQQVGFLTIIDESMAWKNTLSGSMILHQIPALTLELGESFVVNEENVEYGVKAIWNILAHLKMVEPLTQKFQYPMFEELKGRILEYSSLPVSSTSGIIRFLTKPGNLVKKGQPVARVYNAFGKLQETVYALRNGIVLGYSDYSVALPGTPVMAFAGI